LADPIRRDLAWFVGTALVAGAAAADLRAGAVVIGGFIIYAAWRWPEALLDICAVLILAVRPSLDAFGARRFDVPILAVNPAVLFGVGVILVGIINVIRRAQIGLPVWPLPSLGRIHAWLIAAYAVGLLSGARLYGSQGEINGGREVIRVASILFAFLMVLWWVERDDRRIRKGWTLLFVGLAIPVMVACWQFITGTGNLETEGLNRLQGTLSHPNSFGLFLVPFILTLVGGAADGPPKRSLAKGAGAGALSVLLALSYSRTAVLVLAAGLAVLPILHARRFGWVGLRRAIILVTVLIGLGWSAAGDLVRERFKDIQIGPEVLEAAQSGESENSLGWRLINWGVLIQLGREHPWFGHGAGMTTVLNPLVSPFNGVPFNAHDDFVRFFFEAGLAGLACYIVYGILLCSWALTQARSAPRGQAAAAYAVAACILAMFFISVGTVELSLNTAILYELYGMLALTAKRAPVTTGTTSVVTV